MEIFSEENIKMREHEAKLQNLLQTAKILGLSPTQSFIANQYVSFQLEQKNEIKNLYAIVQAMSDDIKLLASNIEKNFSTRQQYQEVDIILEPLRAI